MNGQTLTKKESDDSDYYPVTSRPTSPTLDEYEDSSDEDTTESEGVELSSHQPVWTSEPVGQLIQCAPPDSDDETNWDDEAEEEEFRRFLASLHKECQDAEPSSSDTETEPSAMTE